jgi:probable phosphoglycerate mutase
MTLLSVETILYSHLVNSFCIPKDINIHGVIEELHRIILEKSQKAAPVKNPYLINIMGLPACGKSHRAKRILKFNRNILYISFDSIMESCSYYKAVYVVNKEEAFRQWELPAKIAGYQLLTMGVEKRVPILFEHSNSVPEHVSLYKEIANTGYKIIIKYIPAPPEIVIPRLQNRARFFPESQIHERWKIMQNLLPEYKANFKVEELRY